VSDLFTEPLALALVQLGNVLKGVRSLRDESTLAKQRKLLGQTGLGSECLDIGEELFTRDARESWSVSDLCDGRS
jgi:hypothetical protein